MLSKPRKKARLEPPMVVPAEQAGEVFPAVRYFQIHFEFLQEQIQLILRNQEALQVQMQQLEHRLAHTANGVRSNTQGITPLEHLTVSRTTTESDASTFKLTGGR